MLNKNRQRSGQIGGIATLMKYGNSHFSEIGKMGGRPRQLTAPVNKKGGYNQDCRLPNNLKELKELWANKNGGSLKE